MPHSDALRRIRFWLILFIVGLFLSGVTAFPLQTELGWFNAFLHRDSIQPLAQSSGLLPWIERVSPGAQRTPMRGIRSLLMGTDWLAFAHLVIAVAFIGPFIDPVRNKWIITFGLISCAGVIPLALIAGPIRGIPFPWRLIDCSFGIFGCIPLLRCRSLILDLERQ